MSKFPSANPSQQATENKAGIVRFANSVEAANVNNDELAISPARLQNAPSATTSRPGVVELATDAESLAKSASDKVLTASNLASNGFVQWVDVTLSNSEIKALRATPIEIVAAPGAGNVIQFLGGLLKLNYGGNNAFTESADNLAFKYTDGSGIAVSQTVESTNFIDATADTLTSAVPAGDAIVAATGAENQAIVIHNTGDGEIAGNAAGDNTITLRVYYAIYSL